MAGDGVVRGSPPVGGGTETTVGAGDPGSSGESVVDTGTGVSSIAYGFLVGEGVGTPRVVGGFESTVGAGDGLGSGETGALNGPLVDVGASGETGTGVSAIADGFLVGEGVGTPWEVGGLESTVGSGDGLGSVEKGALIGPMVDVGRTGEGVGGTSGSVGDIGSTVGAGGVGTSALAGGVETGAGVGASVTTG